MSYLHCIVLLCTVLFSPAGLDACPPPPPPLYAPLPPLPLVSPEVALQISIAMNDKFFLDGRDPSGYTGCLWSVGGIHDQVGRLREQDFVWFVP